MNTLPTRILLATDGSEDAYLATQAAIDLSQKSGSELHVVHVWQDIPTPHFRSFVRAQLKREAQEAGGAPRACRSGHNGGPPQGGKDHRRSPRPGRGPRGRPVGLGEPGTRQGRTDPPGKRLGGYRPPRASSSLGGARRRACLATGTGGHRGRLFRGRQGDRGVGRAHRGLFGSGVLLVRVYPERFEDAEERGDSGPPPGADEAARRAEAELEDRAAGLEGMLGQRPRITIRTSDDPALAILEVAGKEGESTLIAVGSRGLGEVRRMMLGSVSTRVVRAATGPVLVFTHPRGVPEF